MMGTYRLAVDTGGTFTDLVVLREDGEFRIYKELTTPDVLTGVFKVLELAADDWGMESDSFLRHCSLLVHGTTKPINAILEGKTADTALLVNRGLEDVLLFREGGRTRPFDFTRPYPDPYIPRRLTYPVDGRIDYRGSVVAPLDESGVIDSLQECKSRGVEAVAVCLLWSIINPGHELRVGELIEDNLPGVEYTLSHQLNPIVREYRRASSTAIDASLKPIMGQYLVDLQAKLRESGSDVRLLMVTSTGGVMDGADVAHAPIYAVGSGPAMGPVAGRALSVDRSERFVIVVDTGGTSFDVTVVRDGTIPLTRETWIGQRFAGHITGMASVDVKSIGAGGGSIAWIDSGGLLRVGPESAGSIPGPACYGLGGNKATFTDACVVLGYVDPLYFLGGRMTLRGDLAEQTVMSEVAERLSLDVYQAGAAILTVITESMVRAIEEITVHQGIDPRQAVMVAGGGAAGLNAALIARRLGCRLTILPQFASALSATGGLMADVSRDFSASFVSSTADFKHDEINRTLRRLQNEAETFLNHLPGTESVGQIEYHAEARYPYQVWELDVPLTTGVFATKEDVRTLEGDFHRLHEEMFGFRDASQPVEVISWRVRATAELPTPRLMGVSPEAPPGSASIERSAYFAGAGRVMARVVHKPDLRPGASYEGPTIVELPTTTIVVPPDAVLSVMESGDVAIEAQGDDRMQPSNPTRGSAA